MTYTISWVLVILAGINSTAGNYYLKKSQQNFDSFLGSLFSYEFFVGCLFYFFNVILFAYALKELDVSKAYPVLASISFLSLSFLSFFLLDESITPTKLIGLIFIIFGIFLLSNENLLT